MHEIDRVSSSHFPFKPTHIPTYYVPRVTVKLHIAVFLEALLAASVVAHSTLVTPNGNVDPELVLHKMHTHVYLYIPTPTDALLLTHSNPPAPKDIISHPHNRYKQTHILTQIGPRVTVKPHTAEFPAASVAAHSTVVT